MKSSSHAILFLCAALAAGPLRAESVRHVGTPIKAVVDIGGDPQRLKTLDELGIDVDGVFNDQARIYVVQEELNKLRKLGFEVTLLPDEAPAMAELARQLAQQPLPTPEGTVPAQYHTYATLTAGLQQIAAAHPNIARLSSIGQSVQGRQLWFVKLTDNPDVEEDEPAFTWISSMHGDEVVGKELLYNLIDYLTTNYGSDPRVTSLIDTTELWFMPSMNPDGTELGQRWNAQGVDLNRDFPDQFVDPINTTVGRAPETAAVMVWRSQHSSNLASNFHGGALVANYPFDSNPAGSSTFSPTPAPDHPTFVTLARTYADRNPPMSVNNSEPAFDDGICNGADWYSINGGMQDWNYLWYGNFEVLVEVSNTKWPSASTLPGFWDQNLESMLSYIERVHEGVRGVVTDAETGLPLSATVRVDANPHVAYTDPEVGDYHRLLSPGTYTLTVSADNHQSSTLAGVVVNAGPATVVDFELGPMPVDLRIDDSNVADGGNGVIDPGETVELQVTLKDLGRSATGVVATLIPTGWDAQVTRAEATFPDIPTGATALSDAPHYEIVADASTPLGRLLGFAVEWHTEQGSGVSDPIYLAVGASSTADLSSTDVPVEIFVFQNFVATSELIVPPANDVRNLSGINVRVNISHTYVGDLEVVLISPSGTEVRLHNHTGGSADNIIGTYGVNLTPSQSLAAFHGEDALGTWTLRVTDNKFGDSGRINSWSLELEGSPAETSTPEIRLRDLAFADGKLNLNWWGYPGLTSYKVYRSTDPSTLGVLAEVTDTSFEDPSTAPLLFYKVTGVGPNGEGE